MLPEAGAIVDSKFAIVTGTGSLPTPSSAPGPKHGGLCRSLSASRADLMMSIIHETAKLEKAMPRRLWPGRNRDRAYFRGIGPFHCPASPLGIGLTTHTVTNKIGKRATLMVRAILEQPWSPSTETSKLWPSFDCGRGILLRSRPKGLAALPGFFRRRSKQQPSVSEKQHPPRSEKQQASRSEKQQAPRSEKQQPPRWEKQHPPDELPQHPAWVPYLSQSPRRSRSSQAIGSVLL
ncbi:hypothetical protein G7046_g9921 [Stylonectria norvegica]|nr:hypothetical protein G7046_g9921 [Stylonectria norvegica]